ncbi:uncharacterized protein K02A2.6-like [Paramacrobiotus metropolitanus]|uniref:uncharacterized protein K02A2.6-like n=1 Tax=Paramacrobiotus metropolitanus TaxID=2943436 RepID=UPI0024460642|nr:uncharacterized protein K02A2.6-like [Paramacrobiotus metropolitanus]
MSTEKKAQNLIRFNPDQLPWTSWKSLLKNYFALAEIAATKQKEVLLNSLEVRAFQDLVSACRPKEPTELSYDELIKKLDDTYIKVTYQTTEWASFFSTRQKSSQSLVAFSNELRDKTYTCKFPGTLLEDLLSSVFVAGVYSDTTRRHLMSQELKSFDETLQIAKRFETGQEEAKVNNNLQEDIVKATSSRRSFKPNGGAKAKRAPNSGGGKACYRCGNTNHDQEQCRFKDQNCRNCGKAGHIARVCKSKQASGYQGGQRGSGSSRTGAVYDILHTSSPDGNPMQMCIKVNGRSVTFELDTGSGKTIASRQMWQSVGSPKLSPYKGLLRSFTGHTIRVLGVCKVNAEHRNSTASDLEMIVADKGGGILGRDWIRALNMGDLKFSELSTSAVHTVAEPDTLESILAQNKELFRDELGCCRTFQAHLYLKPGAIPKFCKPRPVPFALRQPVEEDLERLVRLGVLVKVDRAKWAAPIVIVRRVKRKVRTCADLSTGLNDALDIQRYPLPLPDELFAVLNGGEEFTTIDMSDAYHQVPLDEESSWLVVINTHRGLFRYTRLPFGVAAAPAYSSN